MDSFKVAILGCGTVGGGVAKILLEQREPLAQRAGRPVELAKIVELERAASARRHGISLDYYAGQGDALNREQAAAHTEELLRDPEIDVVVESIGGSQRALVELLERVLTSGKHVVTANKALLAMHGHEIVDAAARARRALGYEASVCAAIPIIRAVDECFTGDEILSLSGIMNGTSNFILSNMAAHGTSFEDALAAAQRRGYAEADPSLDVNGGDAGHKLTILLRLVFGLDIAFEQLEVQGIESTTADDMAFADEVGGTIKLICYAERRDGEVFATVRPMIVKRTNLLAKIDGATNAVRLMNRYSSENVLIGQGAGSLETGSAVVSDIVFLARYGERAIRPMRTSPYRFRRFHDLVFPYNIVFHTTDQPGVTGLVATAIGEQGINIDTVSHNRHTRVDAVFAIATMPCSHAQIEAAIDAIRRRDPNVLLAEPKVTPILE